MVRVQGFLSYLYRGKEFAWDFYAVQPIERLGVEIDGVKTRVPGGYRFSLVLRPDEEIVLTRVSVEIPLEMDPDDRVFVNGFQSWTEKIPGLRWPARPLLRQYGDYGFYRYPRKRGHLHGWTYSYVRSASGSLKFYGSLSERDGYTLFEYDCPARVLRISRDCSGLRLKGEYKSLDFVALSGVEEDVFDGYFALYESGTHERRDLPEPFTGWTSWYNYYTNVSQDVVLANLEQFRKREIPIGLFQIDDGWQPKVGEWLTANSKFPDGMASVASAIKEAGMKAGLWLAPFICEKKSDVWRQHKGWLLRNKRGRPVSAGFNPNWSGKFYALDFYNEGFREYLRKVLQTVLGDWGFDMVKLDFLYAAALFPGDFRTRGQVMTEAMEFLRSVAGDKLILGCGVPLGPAFGRVDACRIGSDVALQWEDRVLRLLGYRERVSTVNSLASTIGRRHLNGRAFLNDPDVFILRTRNQTLSLAQRLTLLRLNLALGGVVLTSDNPSEYTEEELKHYMSIFPFGKKVLQSVEARDGTCSVRFDAGEGHYLLLANLTGRPRDAVVLPGPFSGVSAGERVRLEPFESRLLS
jgi:alpha-galactosidase